MHLRRILTGVALVALVLAAMPALAASLQVAPTGLTLPPARNADVLTLSNSGSQPLRAQVRVFRWSQRDGKDVLEPTRDIVATPAMLAIAPGTSQLVRVVRLATPAADERAYRVLVSELPEPRKSDGKVGLSFALQYSLPVFLSPAPARAGDGHALQARRVGDALEVSNDGRLHARLSQLAVIDGRGQRQPLVPGLLGYVLPGQTMRWTLPQGAGQGRFEAIINDDRAASALPAAPATP